MTALENWQRRVWACRAGRGQEEETLWQQAAAWYDRWVAHNNYVTLVLPHLRPFTGYSARVLEIGPGTGAFTRPLAGVAREVVAVEPSANMRTALQHNLRHAAIDNVQIVAGRIEDAMGGQEGPFDLAFAGHSLYNVVAIDQVLERLLDLAEHLVILIGTGDRSAWYQGLYRRFDQRQRVAPAHFGDLYPVLLEMGIYADAAILETSANYVFEGEAALVEWWANRLHVRPTEMSALRAALVERAERRNGHMGLYGQLRTALVTISRDRSRFRPAGRAPATLPAYPDPAALVGS